MEQHAKTGNVIIRAKHIDLILWEKWLLHYCSLLSSDRLHVNLFSLSVLCCKHTRRISKISIKLKQSVTKKRSFFTFFLLCQYCMILSCTILSKANFLIGKYVNIFVEVFFLGGVSSWNRQMAVNVITKWIQLVFRGTTIWNILSHCHIMDSFEH